MESQTICDVGCLLSSVSMAFTFYHVRVNDKPVDPGTLNTWLKENGGYLSNDELIETTLEQLSGIHYKGANMLLFYIYWISLTAVLYFIVVSWKINPD